MTRRRLIQPNRKPTSISIAEKRKRAALKKAEIARKLAAAKQKAAARAEADRRKSRVAIAFPKGAYQYITDEHPLEDLG